jgi:hypothetical protein
MESEPSIPYGSVTNLGTFSHAADEKPEVSAKAILGFDLGFTASPPFNPKAGAKPAGGTHDVYETTAS